MNARTLIAGVVGGVVLFSWGALSHMALGLGSMGVKTFSNEGAVLSLLRENVGQPGLYLYPAEGMEAGQPTEEQMRVWDERYRQGPTGILVVGPGRTPWDPMLFLVELASNIGAALIAAIVLASVPSLAGFLPRMLLVASLGLFSWLDISVSYWNWYGFPTDYSFGLLLQGVIGWALAGAAMAALLKPRAG